MPRKTAELWRKTLRLNYWDFFSRRGCNARELVDVGVVLSCSCRAHLVAATASEARYAVLGTWIAVLFEASGVISYVAHFLGWL